MTTLSAFKMDGYKNEYNELEISNMSNESLVRTMMRFANDHGAAKCLCDSEMARKTNKICYEMEREILKRMIEQQTEDIIHSFSDGSQIVDCKDGTRIKISPDGIKTDITPGRDSWLKKTWN